MDFEDQLNALIYFHLEEHTSGRHLLQALKEDAFARQHIAPHAGIGQSSFFEAINPKNGSYPAHSMRSGGCQGGRGRMIFATT